MIMIAGSHHGPPRSHRLGVAETRRFPAPPDRDLPCACSRCARRCVEVPLDVDVHRMRLARHGEAAQPRNSDTARGDPPGPPGGELSRTSRDSRRRQLCQAAPGTELQALRPRLSLSGPGPDSSEARTSRRQASPSLLVTVTVQACATVLS